MDRIIIDAIVGEMIDIIQRNRFDGVVSQTVADEAIRTLDWMYKTKYAVYFHLEPDEDMCACGNPQFGFNCMCEWMRDNPGDIEFCCTYCGLYTASKARCSECEAD